MPNLNSILRRLRRLAAGSTFALDLSRLTQAQRTLVHTHHESAIGLLQAARSLHESGEFVPALVLYREAILDFSRMVLLGLARNHSLEALSPDSLFEQFVALLDARAPVVAKSLRQALGGLLDFGSLAIDRLAQEERAGRALLLDRACRSLLRLVVLEGGPRRRFGPSAYLAVIGGGVLGIAALWMGWFGRPCNVALNKPTTASLPPFGGTPQGAVDGKLSGGFGFHSVVGDRPSLTIDLQDRYVVVRAAVYGRNDCCLDQSVPLSFAVSDDGVSYRPIETRTEAFVQEQPWDITPRNVAARFVRLQTLREAALVLSEVELYGTRAE